jgi:hypothetical protein
VDALLGCAGSSKPCSSALEEGRADRQTAGKGTVWGVSRQEVQSGPLAVFRVV